MSFHISEVLKQFVRKHGLEQEILAQRMPGYWATTVGEKMSAISEVTSFDHGTLKVHVAKAAWRNELMLRREEIRTKLNAQIGNDVVKEIIVR
ncbi:MAG: DUF721 domain-containing protein [Ignavibacteria bacterium]|nr:DUF721 domain-containing protein [Ignavibacteria bacterium]